MELKKSLSCPLGHKCQEVKDGGVSECAWFTKMAGENPQTGEVKDEYACAMAWLPILLVENAKANRGTAAAIESFRNEVVDVHNAAPKPLRMVSGNNVIEVLK